MIGSLRGQRLEALPLDVANVPNRVPDRRGPPRGRPGRRRRSSILNLIVVATEGAAPTRPFLTTRWNEIRDDHPRAPELRAGDLEPQARAVPDRRRPGLDRRLRADGRAPARRLLSRAAALTALVALAAGCMHDGGAEFERQERSIGWPVRAAACEPLYYELPGTPDVVIVSDLPMQGSERSFTGQMVQAVKVVLEVPVRLQGGSAERRLPGVRSLRRPHRSLEPRAVRGERTRLRARRGGPRRRRAARLGLRQSRASAAERGARGAAPNRQPDRDGGRPHARRTGCLAG